MQRLASGVSGVSRTATRWAILLLLAQACGDDDDGHDIAATPDAGAGVTNASKDAGSDSSAMRRPMAGNDANPGNPASTTVYLCQPRAQDPGGYQRQDESCCGGLGKCVEGASADPWLSHDTCSASADLRCQPVAQAEAADSDSDNDSDAGTGHSKTCRVELPGTPAGGPDYEGRCMATCFVRNSPIFSRLKQGTCAATETCAPCYNPLTSESTGTCERDGDAPKAPAPPGFAECGTGNLGFCVPTYAAGAQASQLVQLTCMAGEVCAPKIKAADPNACFEHCVSGLGQGACVPEFLTAGFAAFLERDACGQGEVCAPCDLLGTRLGVCD